MFSQEFLTNLFPPERTNGFFEALFGDPEDGAYDIKMSYQGKENKTLKFYFELHARPNQCLRCNLTTGLPPVFERHPIIAAKAMAEKIAEGRRRACGQMQKRFRQRLGHITDLAF